MSSRCGTTARSSQNLGAAAPPPSGSFQARRGDADPSAAHNAKRSAQEVLSTLELELLACAHARAGFAGLSLSEQKRPGDPSESSSRRLRAASRACGHDAFQTWGVKRQCFCVPYRMGISKFKYPEIPKSRDLDPVSTLGGNTVLVFEIPK